MKFVYQIRAGAYTKVGLTADPYRRWVELRRSLRKYGKPRFVGCVEGAEDDERRLIRGSISAGLRSREIRLTKTVTPLDRAFPGGRVYSLREARGLSPAKMFICKLPLELVSSLRAKADTEGRILSRLVEQALREWLAEKKAA